MYPWLSHSFLWLLLNFSIVYACLSITWNFWTCSFNSFLVLPLVSFVVQRNVVSNFHQSWINLLSNTCVIAEGKTFTKCALFAQIYVGELFSDKWRWCLAFLKNLAFHSYLWLKNFQQKCLFQKELLFSNFFVVSQIYYSRLVGLYFRCPLFISSRGRPLR